jgi:opacity protein-like surface antigen
MTTFLGRIAIAIALVSLATTASAQQTQRSRPGRPYTGLFGGGLGDTEQMLEATGSLASGYDKTLVNVAARDPLVVANNTDEWSPVRAAGYGQFGAGLSYSLAKKVVQFSAAGASSTRYFPQFSSRYVGSYSASVGASLALSRRSQLTASHIASYQPYKTLLSGPAIGYPELGQAIVLDQTLGVRREVFVSQASTVTFNRKIGRRTALDLNYMLGLSDVPARDAKMRTETKGARLSTGLNKGLGVHLGYSLTESRLGSRDLLFRGHSIDAGVDFSRDLSLSRRTTFSFSTGSTAVTEGHNVRYRINGHANLVREIGRSWNASFAYARDVGFVEQFSEPFFSDAATVRLDGQISRRLQLYSSVSSVMGQIGLFTDSNTYRSLNASAGVSAALNRHLALGVEYLYYGYGFDQETLLPGNLLRELGRHSARVSLSAWVPLFHRARRPDASR